MQNLFTYPFRRLVILFGISFLVLSCTDSEIGIKVMPEFSNSNTGPFIIDFTHLETVKKNLDHPEFNSEYEKLIASADRLVQRNDFQFVTDKHDVPPSGDKHDYMSVSRYMWPDADDNYTIIRDGQTNPIIYDYDRPKLSRISNAIYTLALAYYFSDRDEYAAKASELLNGWFLDKETRMNPNLKYAQGVWIDNKFTGSHQGIIDTNDFIRIIEGVSLLYGSNHWTSGQHKQLKSWFYLFINWITSHYNPDYSCNELGCTNVSTWFDAQKTIYFLFTEQENKLNSSASIKPISEKIANQFSEIGVQKAERTRALSQHYFYYNLRAYMKIALMRKNRTGFDRDWQTFNSENYGGIKPSLDALVDYLNGEDVSIYFDVSNSFDDCRYLEIFKPATVAFENESYNTAVYELKARGCSNTNFSLTFPSLIWIINDIDYSNNSFSTH